MATRRIRNPQNYLAPEAGAVMLQQIGEVIKKQQRWVTISVNISYATLDEVWTAAKAVAEREERKVKAK